MSQLATLHNNSFDRRLYDERPTIHHTIPVFHDRSRSRKCLCHACLGARWSLTHNGSTKSTTDGRPEDEGNALIRIVRESTERFKDVRVAEAEGYALQFGCVSGPDAGAMGLHFVNGGVVNSGVI